MNYTKKSFTVGALPSKEYRDNWERIFDHRCVTCDIGFAPGTPRNVKHCFKCLEKGHDICDHCKAQDVGTHHKGGLFLCAKCAGLPPKVPAFWTCPDCGGTSSWGAEQLHRCAR